MANKEEIKKPQEEAVKFLGQEGTKIIKSDGTVAVTLRKDAYNALLEAKGITKEVTKAVSDGLQDILSDATNECMALCKKHKGATVVAKLGSGNLSQEIKFIGRKEFNGHNPVTKEAIHTEKFGVVEATLNLSWSQKMKGEDGQLAKCAEEMKAFWDKMKK